MLSLKYFGALVVFCMVLVSGAADAYAACANPAGVKGEFVYNDDFNTLQFCDGTNWIGMSGGSGGGGGTGVTDGDKGDVSVSGAGANWMIDDDVLDFTELSDAMTLDASTRITITGSDVLTLTNTGTGNSLVVEDQASDTTPFVVDASGQVGIGLTAPTQALDVVGKVTSDRIIMKPTTGIAAPTSGGGGGGGGGGTIQSMDTTTRNAISSPATGQMIYNTTNASLEIYLGGVWQSIVTGVKIVTAGAGRSWSTGAYAKNCKEYIFPPTSGYIYAGVIGDGVYTIDPDGAGGVAAFNVYCDMSAGGWTAIVSALNVQISGNIYGNFTKTGSGTVVGTMMRSQQSPHDVAIPSVLQFTQGTMRMTSGWVNDNGCGSYSQLKFECNGTNYFWGYSGWDSTWQTTADGQQMYDGVISGIYPTANCGGTTGTKKVYYSTCQPSVIGEIFVR